MLAARRISFATRAMNIEPTCDCSSISNSYEVIEVSLCILVTIKGEGISRSYYFAPVIGIIFYFSLLFVVIGISTANSDKLARAIHPSENAQIGGLYFPNLVASWVHVMEHSSISHRVSSHPLAQAFNKLFFRC